LYNRPEVAAVPSGLSPTPPIIKKIRNAVTEKEVKEQWMEREE
jgi:hypothetical protein